MAKPNKHAGSSKQPTGGATLINRSLRISFFFFFLFSLINEEMLGLGVSQDSTTWPPEESEVHKANRRIEQ